MGTTRTVNEWSADAWRSEIELMTSMLRTNEALPLWWALRRELNTHGVDPP